MYIYITQFTTTFLTPGGEWNVAHSLALFEEEDVLCVSDRENAKIDCMKAGLKWPVDGPVDRDETGAAVITYTGVGNTYAIAAKGNNALHTYIVQVENRGRAWSVGRSA